MLAGCLGLLVGMAVTCVAIAITAAAVFFIGSGIAGVGFGLAFLGSFRAVTPLAEPDDRAGLVTAIYIVGYLAFSIPALIAGVATTRFGLHSTALVYAAALAVLAAVAVAVLLARGSGESRRPAPAATDRPGRRFGRARRTRQLTRRGHQETAARISSATFFSTAGVHVSSANDTGHASPSSRLAASWNSSVEYRWPNLPEFLNATTVLPAGLA